MIIALFLSACGSSSAKGEKAAPLAYEGITDPAVITVANAEEKAKNILSEAEKDAKNLKREKINL